MKKSLQVLVFQDGLASRNFDIPVRWFSQLGWIIGGSILVTTLSVGLSIQIWRQSHEAQPERLKELEQQIQGLETQLAGALAAKATTPVAATTPAPSLQAVSLPVTPEPAQPAPAVTVTVTATPSAPLSAPLANVTGFLAGMREPAPEASRPLGFTAFAPSVKGEVPWVARPSVPIEMTPPQVQWQGRKLKLRFDIRYVGPEGKSQQGRIIVIARGPETLLVYPSGALNPVGAPSLFDWEQGEYFSVARYRETWVEFPSVDSPIRTLEILLIGNDQIENQTKILIHETLNVPPQGGSSRAADPENT